MMFPLSATANKSLTKRRFRLNVLSKFFKRYRTRQRKILNANAQDYLGAIALRRALAPLATADVTGLSVVEAPVAGSWRPFRVEHTLTGSLRGTVCGGNMTGVSTPNMLDSSSVLFLQNDEGQTMRAIIPSPTTAREMLAQTIESWTRTAGGFTNFWENSGTHRGNVIHRFALRWNLSEVLEHSSTIDMIDASCQKPAAERPPVQVFGKQLREGIVLVTALQVNGNMHVFVPTKFFKVLAGEVHRFIGTNVEPKLIAA